MLSEARGDSANMLSDKVFRRVPDIPKPASSRVKEPATRVNCDVLAIFVPKVAATG
jgi:hypothetical protein